MEGSRACNRRAQRKEHGVDRRVVVVHADSDAGRPSFAGSIRTGRVYLQAGIDLIGELVGTREAAGPEVSAAGAFISLPSASAKQRYASDRLLSPQRQKERLRAAIGFGRLNPGRNADRGIE